tara:strand:- start:548 stop:1081 length:534 start_codon:yes stop_codon:yes gene_type:complete
MEIINFSEDFADIKIAKGVYFEDPRGSLKKTIYGDELTSLMSSIKEVICSKSKKNVIRGLHFQKKPFEVSKFIKCVSGEIIDVFLDIRHESKTFGNYGSIKLNEKDDKSLFIPKGFAHGYGVLSSEATVVYLQSGNFEPSFDFSINPLSLNIEWGIDTPLLSDKDKDAISFDEFIKI